MRSILVTSAGSGVGQAVFDAIQCSSHSYRLVVMNSHGLTPIFERADAAYLSPKTSQKEAFEARLKGIVSLEKPALILAGRDEELDLFVSLQGEMAAVGSVLPLPSSELMLACTDKYLTWKHLGHALPVVETASQPIEIQALIQRWGFPVLLKPRRGFASRGILTAHTPTFLAAFLAEVQEPYIVQPYLSRSFQAAEDALWPELSGQVVIGAEGSILGVFASRVCIAQGLTTHLECLPTESSFAQDLRTMAQTMATMGFRGSYNLQGIDTREKGFQLIEINGRCTGLTGVRAQMGFNEVDMLYDSFVAGKQSPLAVGDPNVAVMQTRFELLSP